jgi:hypothetical protein
MLDRMITPASVRDDLVAWCEDAADWRLYKAAELAGDGRNLASVDALEAAAEVIAELADGDPRLARLARVCSRLGDEERGVAVAQQRGVVRRHGYDGLVTVDELLDQLIRVCEAIGGPWAGRLSSSTLTSTTQAGKTSTNPRENETLTSSTSATA